ncbi:MAG: Gfo/Idh/MocA family oxidoreductase [Caldilineaceae bacterium]
MQPLHFAVIGAGNIGKIQVEAIQQIPEARVTVVCNRGEAAGRALAEKVGATWIADFADAVTRDDVDVVTICTPSGTHMEIAVAAAAAGKHLLIEKPIDITLERVDAILDAVEKAGVYLVCSRYASHRVSTKAKAAVDAGRLGRLTLADVYVKWYRPQSYYDGSWRGTWEIDGGGALMNQSDPQYRSATMCWPARSRVSWRRPQPWPTPCRQKTRPVPCSPLRGAEWV